MDDNEQRAILGGGCISLIIAMGIAAIFIIAAIIDAL
jgi:hypothetical protein